MRWLVAQYLRFEFGKARTVNDLQQKLESYLRKVIDTSITDLTVSGLEKLDHSGAYLFVSNHRDIVMDPAMVNWALYHDGFTTLRIAIGDNLLKEPYVADLARLNKTFVVNRSATSPREKLKAAKHLSSYIKYSIQEENHNIWIAQREGRAKDGLDITNRAIISMFCLNKPKPQDLSEYIRELNLVPVSISYEWDPCDEAKAAELYQLANTGEYAKGENEDVDSIAKGIVGQKGRVHLAFGEPLTGDYADNEAVATEVEQQIQRIYRLHASNLAAFEMIYGQLPEDSKIGHDDSFSPQEVEVARHELEQRLAEIPSEHHGFFLDAYANPVKSKIAQLSAKDLQSTT
jgi:hypothetical protein